MKTKKSKSKNRPGTLGVIMGFSVSSVLNWLGREGVKAAQARVILTVYGIRDGKPATVSWNISQGKSCSGKAANLTKAQVRGLIASV
jgi:hypothetical protein